MEHLHYFSEITQEEYDVLGATCGTCGTSHPGEYGWWEIANQPTCTSCTMIAEEVAEAADEPLMLGQVNTIEQQDAIRAWKRAGINIH